MMITKPFDRQIPVFQIGCLCFRQHPAECVGRRIDHTAVRQGQTGFELLAFRAESCGGGFPVFFRPVEDSQLLRVGTGSFRAEAAVGTADHFIYQLHCRVGGVRFRSRDLPVCVDHKVRKMLSEGRDGGNGDLRLSPEHRLIVGFFGSLVHLFPRHFLFAQGGGENAGKHAKRQRQNDQPAESCFPECHLHSSFLFFDICERQRYASG